MSEHEDEKKTAFPPQEQQPPGLTDQMIPRPDHGEETYRGSDLLVGRKALITGGDSGIGRAVAIAFAREGADVAIGYLPEEKPDASETVRLIEEAGRKAVAIAEDLTDIDACQRLVQAAVEGSAIINTSSIQAYEPSVQLLDYAATKAAVNSITVNLAEQLGPKGIRVNAVAPGPIWTPLQPATRDADKGTF